MANNLDRQKFWGLPKVSPSVAALLHFSLVIFLIFIAESIMSYVAPVYLQNNFHNTFRTGIILSISSLVGFVTDILLGELFRNKSFYHFIIWGCLFSVLFPVSLLLFPPLVTFMVLSMTIWGIYYELVQFSSYHFINHYLSHGEHSFGWSVIGGFRDGASLVGPLLASALMTISVPHTLFVALGFYVAAVLGIMYFLKIQPTHLADYGGPGFTRHSFREEFLIWRLLLPKIWPVILFIIAITMFDAAMWSMGSILSEQIKSQSAIGGLLFVAYLLPSVITGIVFSKYPQATGKKRKAFWLGLAAGTVYLLAGIIHSPLVFMALIFIASFISATLWPLILGVIEDYVERLGNSANLMVSLQNSTTSLAYILGTSLAGYTALWVGEQGTFSVMAGLIMVTSIIGLLSMPGKVRLPQQAIHKLTD